MLVEGYLMPNDGAGCRWIYTIVAQVNILEPFHITEVKSRSFWHVYALLYNGSFENHKRTHPRRKIGVREWW